MDMNHVLGLEKQSFGYCGDYGKPKKNKKQNRYSCVRLSLFSFFLLTIACNIVRR